MKYYRLFILFTFVLLIVNAFLLNEIHKNSLNNRTVVIAISDGDTITVLQNQEQKKIRLAEIDSPEKKQPFGTKSKEILASKIFNKHVEIVSSKKDGFGRIIGEVYLGNRYINKEMVEEGYAWHYEIYSKSKVIAEAQETAKKKKLGLWSEPNPIPPWEFRKK